ncbi:facilitated trehalose transporter Tret1-like [Rhipicephalus microplus]|uniref:facilitated trehalose transporter Tret1-like n=1 Tax=Rhipicephalus microplus TaxID=6941 RepID=UPI003F6CA90D
MEALRRMRPPAKGATPVTDPDSALPFGHHFYAMLVACSGTLAAGTALGFASAAMESIERQPWYDLPRIPPENRWIADSLFLGATVGSLFSGFLMHLVGHRTIMLLSSAGLISSWMCLAVGNSVSVILVGRVACGLFVGVVTNCVCLYVADVAPPAKRTTFGGLPEVAMSAGLLTAYSLSGFPWEVQAGGCALTAVPILAMQRYIVENPRWLLARDRSLDADTAVLRLYGIDPPADFRQRKVEGASDQQRSADASRWPKEARNFTACLLLYLLQNISCAQLCLLRAVQVMAGAVADVPPQAFAMFLIILHIGCTTLAINATKKASRRGLLGLSALLVAAVMFKLRPLDHLGFIDWAVDKDSTNASWTVLLSVGVFVLAYSVGLCHIPVLLTGELVPLRRRYVGSSFVWASRWSLTFVMIHFDEDVLAAFENRGTLLTLSVVVAVVAVTAIALIPETEGRTLTDIHR